MRASHFLPVDGYFPWAEKAERHPVPSNLQDRHDDLFANGDLLSWPSAEH